MTQRRKSKNLQVDEFDPIDLSLTAKTQFQRFSPKFLKTIQFKNKNQELFYTKMNSNSEIIICQAPAGSGKTFLTMHKALEDFFDPNKEYKKILVINPTVIVGNEDNVGYLPGTLEEKTASHNDSMMFVLNKILGENETKKLIEKGVIQFTLVNFLRGANFENSWIIVDEAQNFSSLQLKTLLTRMSSNSKMAILGDLSQCDKYKNYKNSGLYDIWFRFLDLKGVDYMQFTKADCVRSGIVKRILERYEDKDEVVLPLTKAEVKPLGSKVFNKYEQDMEPLTDEEILGEVVEEIKDNEFIENEFEKPIERTQEELPKLNPIKSFLNRIF